MKTIYVFVVAINVVVVAILPLILKAYNLSSETTEIAKQIIWYHAICTCTIWPLSFALPNSLRAANDVYNDSCNFVDVDIQNRCKRGNSQMARTWCTRCMDCNDD